MSLCAVLGAVSAVPTGDNSSPVIWLVIGALALAALVLLLVLSRRGRTPPPEGEPPPPADEGNPAENERGDDPTDEA